MSALSSGLRHYTKIVILAMFFGVLSCIALSGAASAIDGEVIYEGTVAQDYDCTGENCGLKGDDSYSAPVPIGFDFNFYGTTYSSVYLNINGVMHFGCPSSEYSNQALPSDLDGDCDLEGVAGSTKPHAIMAFWDDIITTPKDLTCSEDPLVGECDDWSWEDSYASILYKTVGAPGSRKFIAQWTNMHLFSNPNIPLGTFQIILYEGSNEYQVQYRNLLGDVDRAQGSSATIGAQGDIFNYVEYSTNGDRPIRPELAIRFLMGEGYYYDDEAAYDAVYLSIPGAPEKPVLTFPANTATSVVRNPTFRWSAAANASSYAIAISKEASFSLEVKQVFDVPASSSPSTSFSEELEPNTTYYWNVRATNAVGDVYSETFSFTTGTSVAAPDDNDGIDEAIEDASPNTGDANDDGTPDAEQPNVTSVLSPTSNKYVVLQSNCTDNYNVQIGGESATTPDENYTYPAGLIGFVLRGCTVGGTATITQYYYGSYDLAKITLRKWQDNTYKTVPGAVFTSVVIGGQPAVKVVYQITDGSSLDDDGIADGNIVDPAGMAVLGATTVGAPNTGIERADAAPALVLLIVSTGLMATAATYGRNIFKKEQ